MFDAPRCNTLGCLSHASLSSSHGLLPPHASPLSESAPKAFPRLTCALHVLQRTKRSARDALSPRDLSSRTGLGHLPSVRLRWAHHTHGKSKMCPRSHATTKRTGFV